MLKKKTEDRKNSLLQRGILFSFKGHLFHSLSFFFSGREGEVEISQHALFIICDRHKLSGGDCWGPASECVCPCLKPKQSLLTYTHTHSQTHSTARWQTRESMPILFVHNPKSTYRSLENPQRVCVDSCRHMQTHMGTNLHKSMHLVRLV